MAGDTHITDYATEVPDETFIYTTPDISLASSIGTEFLYGLATGQSGIGLAFDRDTTIDKVWVTADVPADASMNVRLCWAASGESAAAAVANVNRRLTSTIGLSSLVEGVPTPMTVLTGVNRIPAGSRMLLQVTAVDAGNITTFTGVSFTIRGRTRLIG